MTTQKSTGTTHRKKWFDPRFAIGLALVVASVLGVWGIVNSAEKTTLVYSAREPVLAGDLLHVGDLVATPVHLGEADRLYLAQGRLPSSGVVSNRTIAAGELIPRSAVGASNDAKRSRLVIAVHGALASSVVPGAIVDVWTSRQIERGVFETPTVLVPSATVVRLVQDDGLVAARDTVSVELQLPQTKTAALLQAVATEDLLSIVPLSTPLER